MTEIILHIPHSSKEIPPQFMGDYFDVEELNETILKMTDTFTDELFSCDGVQKIVFPYSRAFCDVERFLENEYMETKYGQGFYYTNGVNLKPFRTVANKETVLEKYYKRHHAQLKEMVQAAVNPLIIDCHSFPNETLPSIPVDASKLPDFVLGHNEKSEEIEICDAVREYLVGLGFTVNINNPYVGSLTVDGCNSVMIEINRRLYLTDDYLKKRADYYKYAALINQIIQKIQK